jgi:hypothetical protein
MLLLLVAVAELLRLETVVHHLVEEVLVVI